jgi:hypothetical protein
LAIATGVPPDSSTRVPLFRSRMAAPSSEGGTTSTVGLMLSGLPLSPLRAIIAARAAS